MDAKVKIEKIHGLCSIEDLCNGIIIAEDGAKIEINPSPDYQRGTIVKDEHRPVWKDKQRQKYIESVLEGFDPGLLELDHNGGIIDFRNRFLSLTEFFNDSTANRAKYPEIFKIKNIHYTFYSTPIDAIKLFKLRNREGTKANSNEIFHADLSGWTEGNKKPIEEIINSSNFLEYIGTINRHSDLGFVLLTTPLLGETKKQYSTLRKGAEQILEDATISKDKIKLLKTALITHKKYFKTIILDTEFKKRAWLLFLSQRTEEELKENVDKIIAKIPLVPILGKHQSVTEQYFDWAETLWKYVLAKDLKEE